MGAEMMLERALKKYKYSKKVWGAYQRFRLEQQEPEEAKKLLNRSLQSLSRHKHVEVIHRYAAAEFEFGSAERARVLLEELLVSFPKRTDLMNVYIDLEVKHGHVLQARTLLARLVTPRPGASSKSLKAGFKKYLAFEMKHGSSKEQEHVRQLARNYVHSITKTD